MTPEERSEKLLPIANIFNDDIMDYRKDLAAAIREAVAEEREECAKLADELGATYKTEDYEHPEAKAVGGCLVDIKDFAAAIRARGKTDTRPVA